MGRHCLPLVALLVALGGVGCSIDNRKLSNAACAADAGACPSGSFSVAIVSPSGETYANGTLEIQVTVTGGTADRVELEADGAPVAELSPPYTYAWDTTLVDEDEYMLIARATRGSQSVRSAQLKVIVDRTAPRALSHAPSASSKNVFIDDPITATFSEPLAPASATASGVTLAVGAPGAAPTVPLTASAVTLSGDGTVLSITPGDYVAAKTVRVALNTTLTDRAGNAVEPLNWQFEVPTWQYLGKVGTDTSYYPKLDTDTNGTPYVTYAGGSGFGYLQRWTGSEWVQVGGELRGDLTASGMVGAVSVVVPEPGAPVVALSHAVEGVLKVFVQRWSGRNWEPVGAAILGKNGGGALSPELALGRGGALYLGFLGMTSAGAYDVNAAKWNGSAWEYLGGAANGTSHVGSATVAFTVAANDVPHAAWPEQMGSGNSTVVKRWTGTAWEAASPPVRFDPNASANDPSLTVDAQGVVHLAVAEFSEPNITDNAARFQNGTFPVLGTGLRRPMDATFGPTTPPIAVDAAGRVVMVSKVLEDGYSTFAVRRFAGTTWSALGETLTAHRRSRRVERTAALALTPKGRAVVAFSQSDGPAEFVHVYRSNL